MYSWSFVVGRETLHNLCWCHVVKKELTYDEQTFNKGDMVVHLGNGEKTLFSTRLQGTKLNSLVLSVACVSGFSPDT